MEPCNRCELLPEALPENGILYLAPPVAHTKRQILGRLDEMEMEYSEPYPNVLAIPFGPGDLVELCRDPLTSLNRLELEDTRCLLVPAGEAPSVPQFIQMQPLSSLVSRIRGEWLLDLLRARQLVMHFQPIVDCQDPSHVFAFECLLRGKGPEGDFVRPEEMFRLAKSADLLFQLDRTARELAVQEAARQSPNPLIFINFIPTSIYHPGNCLRTTLDAVKKSQIPPERIVFEVVESETVGDVEHLIRLLDFYRENGFRVALDDLGAGYSSLNLLHDLKPDFVKIDVGLIRDVDRDSYKAKISENLLALARELGIPCIAEGVESEGEWRWLKEHGATYVQGYLFARPASPLAIPVVPGKG